MGAKKEVTDPVDEVTEEVGNVTIKGDEAEATKDDSKAKKPKKAKGKKPKDADEAEGEEAPKNAEEVCVPLLLFIPDGLYWPFCPFAFFFGPAPHAASPPSSS